MAERVGFIGAGLMGHGMARNIVEEGYRLAVLAHRAAHATGHALDVMVSGGLGWQIAEFVRANAGTLGVSEVIYSQKIWTVQRGGEGWRYMSDRGSSTANHYDHVHVTVY